MPESQKPPEQFDPNKKDPSDPTKPVPSSVKIGVDWERIQIYTPSLGPEAIKNTASIEIDGQQIKVTDSDRQLATETFNRANGNTKNKADKQLFREDALAYAESYFSSEKNYPVIVALIGIAVNASFQ